MDLIIQKQVRRIKRHFSSFSSHSIHSRTHFSGPWERRELKESPIHGPLKKVSPLKLIPLGRRKLKGQTIYNNDKYVLFYCYHFIYSEELFYGHIAMLVIIAEGKASFLVRILQANRDNRLEITHFKFLKKLGSGSFGTVYLAKHPIRNELVAVKKVIAMRINKGEARDALRIMIEKEASCHVQGSLHIIQLLDTFTVSSGINQAFYFVYEYADGGDLADLITKIHYGRSYKENSYIFYDKTWVETVTNNPFIMLFTKYLSPQILLGVSALHERGIIHLDLKPENILITKQGIIKVSDLGLVKRYRWFHYSARAEFLTSLRREVSDEPNIDERYIAGTLPYMEPEIRGKFINNHSNIPEGLFDYKITYKADYFSVGLIIFEIMTGFLYGSNLSYSKKLMSEIYNLLKKYKELPLVAVDAFKTVLSSEDHKRFNFLGRDRSFEVTKGKDEGIIDLLISTCKPRKKRWIKYTIPVKVKREGHKVEENILCMKKIQDNIPLFRNIHLESITVNGIPTEILEFLNTPEPLYKEYISNAEVLGGVNSDHEDTYKWPYFEFHLPQEEEYTYQNLSDEKKIKKDENFAIEDFAIFQDFSPRALRPYRNEIIKSNVVPINHKNNQVKINMFQTETDFDTPEEAPIDEIINEDYIANFLNTYEDLDFGF